MEIIASPLGPRMLILTTSIGKMKSIFQEKYHGLLKKGYENIKQVGGYFRKVSKNGGFIIYHILKSVEQKNVLHT